mgnify:CR=1 FL=1
MAKNKNGFLGLLILITTIIFSTPLFNRSSYLALVCVVLWLYMLVNNYLLLKHGNVKLTAPVVLFLCIIFGYRLIGFSDAAWGNYLNQLCFYTCMLFMITLQKGGRLNNFFLWAIWGVLVFNIVDNILLSYLYPQLNYARLYQDEEFLQSINAGGPSFYMFVLFVFNISFFVFLNCKHKLLRFLMLASCLLSATYILGFCYKGITVIFFLFSLFSIYYAKHTKKMSQFVVVNVSMLLLTYVIVLLFSDALVDIIKAVSPHERLTARLVGLIDANDIDASTGSATSRTHLYLMSIKTWLSGASNFIYGIGDHRVMFGAAQTGISQHSDLLDILPIYGLVGLVLIWILFKNAYRIIVSFFDNEYKLQVGTIFMLFVLYGLVEKIWFPMAGCAIFLLLPLTASLVNKNTTER